MPPERRRQRAASDSNPRRDFITAELGNFRLTQSRRIVKDTAPGSRAEPGMRARRILAPRWKPSATALRFTIRRFNDPSRFPARGHLTPS